MFNSTAPDAPAFRIRGSKFKLAKWVLSFFPKHRVYVEPYGGGAGVLLQKEPASVEIFNDIDSEIVNYFRVVRDFAMCRILEQMLSATPFARDEFKEAFQKTDDPIERARRLIVRTEMGIGSMYEHNHAGFRTDSNVRSKPKTAQEYWLSYSDRLTAIMMRFQGVLIENRPAEVVMKKHDGEDVLFYLDPPYMPQTREKNRNSQFVYPFEMSTSEHEGMLSFIRKLSGMVVLSGYDNDLYNDLLTDWKKESKQSLVSAFRGTKKNIECLWINPQCTESLEKEKDFQRGLI